MDKKDLMRILSFITYSEFFLFLQHAEFVPTSKFWTCYFHCLNPGFLLSWFSLIIKVSAQSNRQVFTDNLSKISHLSSLSLPSISLYPTTLSYCLLSSYLCYLKLHFWCIYLSIAYLPLHNVISIRAKAWSGLVIAVPQGSNCLQWGCNKDLLDE